MGRLDDINANIASYNNNSTELSLTYGSITTEEIMPRFVEIIKGLDDVAEKAALDIGCGIGRDAYWLASQGFDVTACDGAAGMIDIAVQSNSDQRIDYLVDEAPALSSTLSLQKKFDVILMNAFVFHFDYKGNSSPLDNLFGAVISMANPGAVIYTNLRHGPVPPGRKMYDVCVEDIEHIVCAYGMELQYLGKSKDGFGRQGVYWDDLLIKSPN